MTYVKTNWENGKTPINAENLNKIEEGIANAVVTDSVARLTNVVSRNLFNPSTDVVLIDSYYSSSDGNFYSEPGYNCLKIKVQPNKIYVISTDATNFSNISFWDNNFNFKEGLTGNLIYNISVPNDTYYITLAIKNDYTYFQIEEGSIATPYVPYLNLEEAMQGSIYSKSEQRIGTWIDGKPLYRRVIHLQNIDLGSANEYVIHDISNYDVVFVPKYFIYNAADINALKFKMVESTCYEASANSYMHILAFQNNLLYQSNMWKYIEYGYVVIEYTKKTD